MSSEIKIRVSSQEGTELLGEKLGKQLVGGEVIELISDLGGGKTTFTRGLARGIGSDSSVSSPTFTISNIYPGSKVTVHHYDFYRLGELGLMSEDLREAMDDPKVVVVMEWADDARSLLPEDRTIRIYIDLVADDENARELRMSFGSGLEAIQEKLT